MGNRDNSGFPTETNQRFCSSERPFPAFDEIRSILLLEEISLDDRKQNPTTLIAATVGRFSIALQRQGDLRRQ